MRILNWNTEANKKFTGAGKPQKVCNMVSAYDADIVCLTEAYSYYLPQGGHTIMCQPENGIWGEEGGPRKVYLWCRDEWTDVDDIGSPEIPHGRFVSAKTWVARTEWTIIGMCIPWRDYGKRKGFLQWQGACDYLDALRLNVLPRSTDSRHTILVGDFNLQIPPFTYPYVKRSKQGQRVNQKRKDTFSGWLIPTAGIRRGFIDHVAMSQDLRVESMQFVKRLNQNGKDLIDHDGVFLKIAPDDKKTSG